MTITGTIRFVVGAALVAAGGTLVAPLATKLVAVARACDPVRGADRSPAVPFPMPGAAAPGAPVAPSPAPTDWQVPPAEIGAVESPARWTALAGSPSPDSAGGLQLDRCPPPPPAPLPSPPQELAQASPALGGAYRSTLQVPPPQLLDATGPPPTASWAEPLVAAAAPAVASVRSPVAPSHEITVPATYRVRDGDDLGTIAGRFYGDTAAAPAIWAANRETIQQPDLLPIGAELQLPPPWAVHGLRRPVAGAIEPVSYAPPVATPAGRHAGPAPRAVPWLAPAADPPLPSADPRASALPSSAGATVVVRVGPGETLVSLARRLYGDPAMAEQIFASNRDRLRSPDLLVAGMELRLPRPVTAPAR